MGIRVNLDHLLLDRNLTLTELAERVDVTIVNLSILKTNKAKRFSTLEALCRELDCHPVTCSNSRKRKSDAQTNANPLPATSFYLCARPVSFRNVWFSWQMNSIGSEPSATICWMTLTLNGLVYAFASSTVNSMSSRP
jgi:putative transcriptional regulator